MIICKRKSSLLIGPDKHKQKQFSTVNRASLSSSQLWQRYLCETRSKHRQKQTKELANLARAEKRV
jgi:hypothetical protein